MFRLNRTIAAALFAGGVAIALVGGCTFDDRDLTPRDAFGTMLTAGEGQFGPPGNDFAGSEDSCEDSFNGICEDGGECTPGTDAADCFTVNGDNLCIDSGDGICDEGFLCSYGSDTADCSDSPHDDSCEYAFDGWCDDTFFCDPGTDYTDCSTLTRTVSCGFAYSALLDLYQTCWELDVVLDICEGADEETILDMFGCAHEALATSCEDLDDFGLPVFCELLEQEGLLAYTLE